MALSSIIYLEIVLSPESCGGKDKKGRISLSEVPLTDTTVVILMLEFFSFI